MAQPGRPDGETEGQRPVSDRPPMEPSADWRTMANQFRQMFVALSAEGFSEREALMIVGQVVAGAMLRGPD